MKRDYKDGISDNMNFFIGNEVEHNRAFGMRTLFVVGIQNEQIIEHLLTEENSYRDTSKHIKQIFFGANHSFNPKSNDDWGAWEDMIRYFLDQGYWCSLDIPAKLAEEFLDTSLNEYNNFIGQIRLPIPYVKQWNYNTVIKIDDKDFNATNPGVWCHSLHTLMDPSKFTDWTQYKNDKGIK